MNTSVNIRRQELLGAILETGHQNLVLLDFSFLFFLIGVHFSSLSYA